MILTPRPPHTANMIQLGLDLPANQASGNPAPRGNVPQAKYLPYAESPRPPFRPSNWIRPHSDITSTRVALVDRRSWDLLAWVDYVITLNLGSTFRLLGRRSRSRAESKSRLSTSMTAICSDGGCVTSTDVPARTEKAPSEPSTLYLEPTTDTDVPGSTDGAPVHESEQPFYLVYERATSSSPLLRPLLRFIHHRDDRLMGALAGLSPPPPPTATFESEISIAPKVSAAKLKFYNEANIPTLQAVQSLHLLFSEDFEGFVDK
ncbi:hypothetical protein FHL15_010097 [Xylaria flabelliformis]|uniref:Uncharacterized protein n=1 Tax=Xylaria flabelliformis TaxID=2512241 RepID=A0A553HLZ1_9PEZI|nr:hypothetical protein FHL15_010097 [Xylaria flabelliformis]